MSSSRRAAALEDRRPAQQRSFACASMCEDVRCAGSSWLYMADLSFVLRLSVDETIVWLGQFQRKPRGLGCTVGLG